MASTIQTVLNNSSKEERVRIEQEGPIMRAESLIKVFKALKDAGVDVSASDPISLLNAAANFIDRT